MDEFIRWYYNETMRPWWKKEKGGCGCVVVVIMFLSGWYGISEWIIYNYGRPLHDALSSLLGVAAIILLAILTLAVWGSSILDVGRKYRNREK